MEKHVEKKIELSIIIVTYNSSGIIEKCLESLKKTVKKNKYEIIVVDNASTDGTASVISNFKFQISNFKFVQNEKNVGFSKANNQGVKIAQKSRYVLFLNPDSVMYENTIDGMVDFIDKYKDAGAATCFVELKNGELDDSCHRGFPTPWRSFCYFSGLSKLFPKSKLFAGYNMTYLDFGKTHEIDALSGSFMLVRREIGEKLGWWDEDYFFYGEDVDFCFRIKEIGYKIYFVPDYKALHYKGVSSGIKKVSKDISRASKETKIFATRHRFNAMKIFYKKHYVNKYPKIITWLVMLAINLKLWFSLKRV